MKHTYTKRVAPLMQSFTPRENNVFAYLLARIEDYEKGLVNRKQAFDLDLISKVEYEKIFKSLYDRKQLAFYTAQCLGVYIESNINEITIDIM